MMKSLTASKSRRSMETGIRRRAFVSRRTSGTGRLVNSSHLVEGGQANDEEEHEASKAKLKGEKFRRRQTHRVPLSALFILVIWRPKLLCCASAAISKQEAFAISD